MREGSSLSTLRADETAQGPSRDVVVLRWLVPDERTLRLDGRERFRIGRADDADWIVPGPEASRYHAELRRDGPLWIVHDLDSTNGTFVNGERTARAPLAAGTVLRVGRAVAVVGVAANDADETPLREVMPGFYAGPHVQRALEGAKHVAESDLPVIIEGETGTGKERISQWIHALSGRSGRLVALNCAALPEPLAEAELFGYRKGAFTGAQQNSLGHFRAADGGTLLLDEVLDLPLSLQAKLLRVIEQREVTPLGDSTPVPVDVRVLAASQASLARAVEAGRFRGDLWARMNGLTVRLPPLRERMEDVVPLFKRFLDRFCGGRPPPVEARLVEALCLHDWPFNVRELELRSRHLAVAHAQEGVLRRSHLPENLQRPLPRSASQPAAAAEGDEYTRFIALLRIHGGVVARAAEATGISRMRAYRLMKEHDFDPDSLRGGSEDPP